MDFLGGLLGFSLDYVGSDFVGVSESCVMTNICALRHQRGRSVIGSIFRFPPPLPTPLICCMPAFGTNFIL